MDAALSICRRPLKTFQQPKQSEKGPRWVKDKAVFWCKHCNTDFSVVVRKHHCRHCGHIFCSHCCNNKRTLIKFGYLKPVRLCNKCNASCFKADLLLNAVGLNDLNTVKKICEEGCDVHFTTTIFPALTIAANRGSSDMVRMLLRYGADVNHSVPATDSGTVVQCSRCGRTQAAGSIKDKQYECTYCGNFTRHADASDSDHTGITALHAAVQKEGHLDVVVALLEHGADVDTVTAKGNTPLMYACAGGHVECSNVLLEYGASPSIKSEADLDTPLHKSVREGHIEIVRLLLRHNADLDSQNIAGLSAQQLAERCKRADIASILASATVRPNADGTDVASGGGADCKVDEGIAASALPSFVVDESAYGGLEAGNMRLTEEERVLREDAGARWDGKAYGAGPMEEEVEDQKGTLAEHVDQDIGAVQDTPGDDGGGFDGGVLAQTSRDLEDEEVRKATDLVAKLEMEEQQLLASEGQHDEDPADFKTQDEIEASGAVETAEKELVGDGGDGGEGLGEVDGGSEEADDGLVVRKGKKKGKGGGKKK